MIRKVLYLVLLLGLATSAFATHTFNADSTIITITDLSDSVTQSMHRAGAHANDWVTIKLNANVMSGTSRLGGTIGGVNYYYIFKFVGTCHHWTLDLSGVDGIPRTADDDTAYFGDDRNNNIIGVYVTSPSYSIRFRGGVWWHKPTGLTGSETTLPGTYTDYYAIVGVRVGDACHDIYFDSVKIRAMSSWTDASGYWGAYTVRLGGGGYNYLFNNAYLINRILAYPDRQLAPGRAISFTGFTGAAITWSDTSSCAIKIRGGKIESSMKGLYTEESSWGHYDSTRIKVYACSVKTDAVELYNVGSYASTTNSYGIHGRYWGKSSMIRKCLFTAGTDYQGGRPIMLEHWNGRADQPIYVDSNRLERVHEGVDRVYASVATSTGMKLRQPAIFDPTARGFLRVEWNSITVLADTCTVSSNYGTGYGPKATGIAYEWWNATTAEYTFYDSIQNNVCSVLVNPNNSNPGSAYAWRMTGFNFDQIQGLDTTSAVTKNTFVTEQYGIGFGFYDGYVDNKRVTENTIKIDTTIHPNLFTPSQIGSWTFDFNTSSNNYMRDNVFQGAAADTQFRFGATAIGMSGKLERLLRVHVKNDLGAPVEAATVTVKDAYNTVQFTGLSDANGNVTAGTVYWYDTSGVSGDLFGYNPFQVVATKGAQSDTSSKVVSWITAGGVDTLILDVSGVITANRYKDGVSKMKARVR